MARNIRLDPIDGWHHVMSRGVDRSTIFFSTADRLDFGRLLERTVERFGVEVHAYCLMTNHFHLLVRCPRGNLSDAMHHVLSIFARRANNRAGRVGHLFGDRFCSRLIIDVRYLVNVLRYIHLNPLDIAGVETPEAYRWSSHRTYLGLRPRPDWLRTDTALSWFQNQAGYAAFIGAQSLAPRRSIDIDNPEAVTDTVDMLLAERSGATYRHLPAQRRAAALSLAESLDEHAQDQLLECLGLVTVGSIRTAKYRARETIRDDLEVREIVALAHRLLDFSAQTMDDLAA